MKKIFAGLSLRPDKHFVRNIVIVVGVVLVWRGVWILGDMYISPNNPLYSALLSILFGIVILYLPDGHLEPLGYSKEKEEHLLNHSMRDGLSIATIVAIAIVAVLIVIAFFRK